MDRGSCSFAAGVSVPRTRPDSSGFVSACLEGMSVGSICRCPVSVATAPRRAGRTGPGRCFGGWTFCCRLGLGGRLLGAFPSWAGRWGVWARAWGRRIRSRTAAATRCCRLRGRRPSRQYWRSTSRHPPDKCNNTPQHYLLPASATAISGTLPYSFLNLSGVSLAQAARAESPMEPPIG